MDHSTLIERLRATFTSAGLAQAQADAVFEGRTESLSEERALALLTLDADAIQRTLLASPRPVTIAGASAALADWDAELRAMRRIPSEVSVLFSGGGAAVMLAPAARAESLARELESKYLGHMFARATAAWIRVSPRELVEGPRTLAVTSDVFDTLGLAREPAGFGGCMANLAFELRRAKLAARPHSHLSGPTTVARCEETGDRPRAEGGKETRSLFAREHRRRGAEEKKVDERAQSLDHLLEKAKAQRLAFVCIDGARIGKLLVHARQIREYVELSERLAKAFNIDEGAEREIGLRPCAHQVVLAGGDDLLLVAPAEAGEDDRPDALELTRRLVARIERAFEGTPWPVGVGAGVLIAGRGLPARFAFEYARALCDSAKRAIGDERSGVDFEVVLAGSPLSSSIGALREQRTAPKLRDTQRPYSRRRFEDLLERARALRDEKVGQSALGSFTRAIRQALDTGDVDTAMIDIHYQLARDASMRRALGIEALDPNQPSPWILDPPPRQEPRGPSVPATGLVDLTEVFKLQRRR